jgi:hypothetical protein
MRVRHHIFVKINHRGDTPGPHDDRHPDDTSVRVNHVLPILLGVVVLVLPFAQAHRVLADVAPALRVKHAVPVVVEASFGSFILARPAKGLLEQRKRWARIGGCTGGRLQNRV